MKPTFRVALIITICGLSLAGCKRQAQTPEATHPDASPTQTQVAVAETEASITPPVLDAVAEKDVEPMMLKGPNAVPKDTRIVVNIPAFRMDVFARGALIKSYKIGIGYPQFPLPQGLRKAQLIIFNPTWTPPDSPWVNTMAVTPGQVIEAGSKQNPLGPIKIPIGMPSLIHGGKPPAKIGNFASHGCVGMTNAQVKDFARVLARAANTDLSDEIMTAYLKKRTRTCIDELSKDSPYLFKETLTARAKNYESWNITKQGIRLNFDACKVDSCAAGEKRVEISFAAINDLLKSNGPLNPLL